MTPTPAERDPLYARGVALVLLGAMVLSSGGPIIRQVEDATDWQIAFYRGVAQALMVLVVLAVRQRGRVVEVFRNAGMTGLFGGTVLGLGNVCYVLSISNTTIANTMFLLSTIPFLTAIVAWVILRERVRPASWVAIGLATIGVAVMVQEGIAGGRAFGNIMALAAAMSGALFYVAIRAGRRVDMIPTVCIAGAVAAILAGAAGGDFSVSAHDLFYSALMGAGQVGIGMLLYTLGARHIRAAELSILSLTEFIVSPIWGWLIVGEIPTSATLAGGVVILGAVGGLALWSLRRPAAALG
jgi:DME family drug/metabolite transporter